MTQAPTSPPYDLIVVGSGATGGWVAKRAAEAGLQVALVEAGRKSDDTDYREHVAASALPYRGRSERPLTRLQPQQSQSYACDEWNAHFFVNDLQEPYVTGNEPFPWVGRTRLVGGRTNVWGRQSYRFSDLLLLDADPTKDIRATRTIHVVIQSGRVLDRASLDRMLAEVRAAADR